jgi:hypothetical protein
MLQRLIDRIVPSALTDYALDVGYGLLHPRLLRSGATDDEAHRPLAGDDLLPEPMWQATRAITIGAPAERVWQWIVQMGWGRGGWYWWADPFREGRGSVDAIVPELQTLGVGDVLLDGPGCDRTKGAWLVRALEPGHSVVLYSARDPISGLELDMRQRPGRYIDCSWAFVLVPSGATTRLLVRTRVDLAPAWAAPLGRLLGAGDTVMQRTMLAGIKQRAERDLAARPAPVRRGADTGRSGSAAGKRASARKRTSSTKRTATTKRSATARGAA